MKLYFCILAVTLSTLSASASTAPAFVCIGKSLYSAAVPSVLTAFETDLDCRLAVQNSKNGFLCAGSNLYSSNFSNIFASFQTEADCRIAINASK